MLPTLPPTSTPHASARSLAPVLGSLAGAPMGWTARPDPRRRGSFLILVVGTLALLAVITIVYVALGNQDSRTKAAAYKRQTMDEVPSKMADYIAQVIANDALSVSASPPLDPAKTFLDVQREATDVPSIRYEVKSDPSLAPVASPISGPARVQFNATGTVDAADIFNGLVLETGAAELNYVIPSDPWLASSEPTYLDHAHDGYADPTRPYLDQRDWEMISNVAPDGGFVNLFNLRPTGALGGYGFRATPGEMRGITNPANGKTLYDRDGNAVQIADWNSLDVSSPDAQNHPYFWTARQRNAFRPAAIGRGETLASTWASPGFRLYQWADADGDGFLDSRYYEMKKANGTGQFTDLISFPGNYRYFFATRIVDLSGRVNINTAGDLASQPMDLTYRATLPLGTSPADIDLLRVLRYTDMMSDNIALSGGGGGAWDTRTILPGVAGAQAAQEAYLSGTGAYHSLRIALASGAIPPMGQPANEAAMAYAFSDCIDDPAGASLKQFWLDVAGPSGATSFVSQVWLSNYPQYPVDMIPLGSATTPLFSSLRSQYYRLQAAKFRSNIETISGGATPTYTNSVLPGFGIDDLGELLTREGINNPSVTSALEAALAGRDVNVPELSPLRSRSPLDLEMSPGRVRYELDANQDAQANTGTVSSERDQALQLAAYDVRHQLTTVSGARALRSSQDIGVYNPTTGAYVVDPATSAQKTVPIVGNNTNFTDELSPDEVKPDLKSLLTNATLPLQAAAIEPQAELLREAAMRRIFRGYADALAPYSNIPDAWPAAPTLPITTSRPFDTLFYGYSGPELALLTAGHMAVNLRDMADTDTRPTVATLVLSQPALATVAALNQPPLPPPAAAPGLAYPAWTDTGPDGVRLSLDKNRLAPSNAQTIAPAVNIYGIEPQPFLTQVTTMTAYMDDRDTEAGGDDPSDKFAIDGTIPPLPTGTTATADNRDLLFRLVAFTLTNPFDVDVQLTPAWLGDAENPLIGGAPLPDMPGQYVSLESLNGRPRDQRVDTARDFYYIQWGDRVYYPGEIEHVYEKSGVKLTDDQNANIPVVSGTQGKFIVSGVGSSSPDQLGHLIVKPISIRAGQTVVCYAISRAPREVMKSVRERGGAGADVPVFGESEQKWALDLLKSRLVRDIPGLLTNDPDRVAFKQIAMIAPGDGTTTDGGKLLAAEDLQYDPIPLPNRMPGAPALADTPGAGETVNLWRAIRVGTEDVPATTVNPGPMWDGTGISAATPPKVRPVNDPNNDQLVDRFRLTDEGGGHGGLASMNLALPGGENDITGSDDDFLLNPDSRYSITLWASCARRNDRKDALPATAAADRMPRDVIPAYCIEPKYRYADDPLWNIGARCNMTEPLPASTFDDDSNVNVTRGEVIAKKYPKDWVSAMQGSSSMFDTDDPMYAPKYRKENPTKIDTGASSTLGLVSDPAFANPRNFDGMYPQINSATDQRFVSNLRLTDALLPLSIGPQETPYTSVGALSIGDPEQFNQRYTTLGEAIAIAQGYGAEIPVPAPMDQSFLWNPYNSPNLAVLNQASQIPEHELLFDRGNLHLDWFVPFLDANTDLQFKVADGDVRAGLSIPAALAVLEQFTVNPTDAKLSLTYAVPGVININTATRAALRALPLASPPDLVNTFPTTLNSALTVPTEDWYAGAPVPNPVVNTALSPFSSDPTNPLFPSNAPTPTKVDLASVIDAYRTKYTMPSRAITQIGDLATAYGLNAAACVRDFFDDVPGVDDPGNDVMFRGDFTDINGLSDLVGLHSVGELLAVRERADTGQTNLKPFRPETWRTPLGLDFMGYDVADPTAATLVNADSSTETLESIVSRPGPGVVVLPPDNKYQPPVANEYDEKLSIAGAMTGVTSVRSDIYAVWFVVAGFQPSDIDAVITPNDPLVPSLQRRFLMVVDRSNVTKKDQKPRILLLKEVPM